MSGDATVKKVSSATSPRGEMGQIYPASGKRVAMRLWRDEAQPKRQRAHGGRSRGSTSCRRRRDQDHPLRADQPEAAKATDRPRRTRAG